MHLCEPALGFIGAASQDGPVHAHVHPESDYFTAGTFCLGGVAWRSASSLRLAWLWAFQSTQETLSGPPAPCLLLHRFQQSSPFSVDSPLVTIYYTIVSAPSRDNMYRNFLGRERQNLAKPHKAGNPSPSPHQELHCGLCNQEAISMFLGQPDLVYRYLQGYKFYF